MVEVDKIEKAVDIEKSISAAYLRIFTIVFHKL